MSLRQIAVALDIRDFQFEILFELNQASELGAQVSIDLVTQMFRAVFQKPCSASDKSRPPLPRPRRSLFADPTCFSPPMPARPATCATLCESGKGDYDPLDENYSLGQLDIDFLSPIAVLPRDSGKIREPASSRKVGNSDYYRRGGGGGAFILHALGANKYTSGYFRIAHT